MQKRRLLLYILVFILQACSKNETAQYYFDKTIHSEESSEYKDALVYINKALELDTLHTSLYLERCNIYFELEKFEEAIEDCKKAISIDKSCVPAYLYMGNGFSSIKNDSLAIRWYSTALWVYNNNPGIVFTDLTKSNSIETDISVSEAEIKFYRGVSYYNLGLDSLSIPDFQFAEKRNFRKEDAQLFIGLILVKYNQAQGCKYLKISADSGNEDAKAALVKFCK